MQKAGHNTQFIVTGVTPGASVSVFRLESTTQGPEKLVARDGRVTGFDAVMTVHYASRRGLYDAVELLPGVKSAQTSELFGWKMAAPVTTSNWINSNAAISPSGSLGVKIRDAAPNGPIDGTISVSNANGAYTITWNWSGLKANDLVQLIGAGPENGGNPFDNPPSTDIWENELGNVQTNGTVSFTITQNNLVPSEPLSNKEWFVIQLFSGNESPAGQLPEVPYAVALPFVLAVPAALWLRRSRSAH